MTDKQKRDAAVDAYADAIKKRLDQKAKQCYTEWYGEYPSIELAIELASDAEEVSSRTFRAERSKLRAEKVYRKLLIDIGARAMMLHHRIKE